ncbi:MAG: mercury(II) reductase [Patescibacteria group bacterium]|nr:MAG: mercury(II) reductase [Patescibacteria group bacterium]
MTDKISNGVKTFDLIIIGGGAGAFAAAIRANEISSASGGKIKTAMINAGLPLGGTCVNVGCLPSKILLHAGEVLHAAKHHNIPGIEIEVKNFDFNRVIKDELIMVDMSRRDHYDKVLEHLEHVTFIEGRAMFVSKHEIEVNGKKLAAKKFIIATGSTANVPPIEGIRETGYVTHIEALKLTRQPKELIVVGAGPVGLEFAQMYARFGTKVTVLEFGQTIFRPGEPELMAKLRKIMEDEGITIFTNAKVIKASRKDDKKIVTYEHDGKTGEISADEILLAVGKTPNTKDLALEKSGIKIDKRKAIIVNKFFRTNKAHIFAVGDVSNAPLRLETTAGHEGTLASKNALGGTKDSIDYDTVPYAIFTDPQFASVGWTEARQVKETGTCACRTVPFTVIPKAQVIRRTEGLIKMSIDPKTKRILGIHILAPNASDLIAQAATLIKNKNTIDDVIHSTPVFPTLSEAIKYAALAFVKDISKLSCCI